MKRVSGLAFLLMVAAACGADPGRVGSDTTTTSSVPGSTVALEGTTPTVSLPDDFELPEGNEPVAQFAFKDGAVVVIKHEQRTVTSFWTAELFTGGGEGLAGGAPGETWQGCYWFAYSRAGYAIVIVGDPDWTVHLSGELVAVIPVGDVAMALVEGFFDRSPTVAVSDDGEPAC